MKRIFPRKALSLAALVWCSATASIHAQIYESLFTNLYYSLFLTNTLRLYVPEECGPTGVMGVLMFFNGSGEDRRFMTQIPWVQNFARTHRFAVMATDGNWELDNHNRAQFFQDLTNILRLAEAISGRTNLLNAPYMFMGHSFGAFSANYVGLEASDRTIGYVAHKAHYWDYEYYRTPSYTGIWSHLPLATNIAGRYVIGAFVPGERDGNGAANPWRVQHEAYQYLLMDGGQVSFAIDYDTGHDDTLNQGHDFGFSVMSEAIRLRHPGFVPATGYTPLAWLPITNGWLVDRVLLSSNPSPVNPNSTIVVRPLWPTMTNFSAYTAPLTNASWLPSRGAARAYRAFTSTQPTYQKRVPAPKQNPLVIETPVRFQRFRAGDAVRVVADTREWTAAKRMTLFVNDVEIGTLTNRPWVWTVPNISTGAHTLVVEASDEQGTNYAAFVFITADGPLTRTNRWTGGATNNHFGAAANWSGGTNNWRHLPAGGDSARSIEAVAVLRGDAANNQRTINTANSMSVNPYVAGIRIESTPSATDNFTITGGRRLHIGSAGVVNSDNTVFSNRPDQIWLDQDQTWAADGGPIAVIGSTASVRQIRLGYRSVLFSSRGATLTFDGPHDILIEYPLIGFGSILKRGSGTTTLLGTNTFGDTDWYFEHPFQHETIVVEDGTLRLAGGATINASNRLLVAEGGNAVFDINNRPVTVASLRGGGRIELGSTGSLRVAHRFSLYNMTQTIETILIPSRWRGTIAGGTAGATSLVFSAGPNSFHTWLGGSNAHAGVTLIEDGMLQVAHSWALGQRGAGNETLVRTNTSLRLVAGGMNVPEDLILLASGNGRPLVNAEGDNELSGTLRITTVTNGANVDIYLANEASNRLLRFSGVLTGMDNPSETNLQARIFLVAAPGATVEVSGAVANFTGGVTRLFLRRSSNDAPSRATFRLSSTNSTFDGGLTLLNGTLLVGADAPASGPGAFGSNNLVVGASWAAVANENLAVLIDGPYTVGRNLTVNNVNTSGITTLGGIGAHTSVLSGTVTFGGSREIRLTAGSGGYVRITGRLNDGTNTVSLRKVGAGVLTLERAAGNDVDGSVIVEEGTLLVSNTSGSGTGTGPVQVRTNGWLGGTGIITGSLSVAGGLTFELSTPPASHDQLDVQSGLVFSNGAKVRVAVLGGATTGTYVLANAVGGVSGPLPALELTGTSWSGVLSMAGTELRLELMGAGGAPLTPYQAWAQARITNGLTNELDDADGDGVANWEEWVADSDPMVTNAAFGAVGIQLDGGNLAALFISSTQRLYTLEYTTSLEGNWWSNVPGQVDIPGSGGVTNLSMPAVTNAAFRLRVRVPEN